MAQHVIARFSFSIPPSEFTHRIPRFGPGVKKGRVRPPKTDSCVLRLGESTKTAGQNLENLGDSEIGKGLDEGHILWYTVFVCVQNAHRRIFRTT